MAVRPLPTAHRTAGGSWWPALRPTDVVVALALAAWIASSALLTGAFTDWELEAQGPALALQRGDLDAWAAALPAYGGGMTLRAPGMLLGGAVGGGDLDWTFRVDGATGLLALVCLALVLVAAIRRGAPAHEGTAVSPVVLLVLGLVVAGPLAARALEVGHPEELVGGVLCVAAVLAAGRSGTHDGRSWSLLAGALLGAAVANKAWAVLAVLPVLALLSGRRARLWALAAATGAGVVLLAPSAVLGTAHVGALTATGDGAIFKPQQLFYLLGEPGHTQPSPFGPIPGRRAAPAWAATVSHPLIVVLGTAVASAWWASRPGSRRTASGALLLLAALFWWRCLLDTWNADYYLAPALLCLVAADVARGRTPWTALAATGLATVTLVLPDRLGLDFDLRTVLHLLWAVPFGAGLLLAAFRGPSRGRRRRRTPQPTSTSSFGSPAESTRWPSAVTTTRSSIRTPQLPGT